MTVDELPDSHVHLVFAMILFLDGMLSTEGLRSESIAAFGELTGAAIADQFLSRQPRLGLG
jgi:hypothetical protein